MERTSVPKSEHRRIDETLPAASQKIIATLFAFPEMEFSLSELAKKADVGKSTASRIVQTLKEEELIIIEDKKVLFRIRANTRSFQFIKKKITHNLGALYESSLVEFLEQHYNHPPSIILFGSYRKGEDVSTSDIDIAIETLSGPAHHIPLLEKITVPMRIGQSKTILPSDIGMYERYLGRKIEIHEFNKKKIEINLFNNIANGIVLSGFLEVKP